MKTIQFIFLGVTLSVMFVSCSGDSGEDTSTEPTYESEVANGWRTFEAFQYDSAQIYFEQAIALDSSDVEAFAGLGWAQIRLDNLTQAGITFQRGSTKYPVSSDLFASWSFCLNAQKAYDLSNAKADSVLLHNSSWQFAWQTSIDASDLRLVKAANYYALGAYASSLSMVQALNPSFTADVTTDMGQAALGAEIERLRATI